MSALVSIVFVCAALFSAFAFWVFRFRIEQRLAKPPSEEQVRTRQFVEFAGMERVHATGYFCAILSLMFLLAAVYVWSGYEGIGQGLRFGIQLVGGGFILLALLSGLLLGTPIGLHMLEITDNEPEWVKKTATVAMVVGVLLLMSASFIL